MRTVVAIDASGMTRFAPNRHPLWWGVLGVVTIEGIVVATLLVSYFYLKAQAAAWPPPGVEPPDLLLPSVNVVLLGASAFTMWWAGQGINRGNKTVLAIGTGASVLLATLVLVLRTVQMAEFEFAWNDHAYGSIVWTITGFHYTHVASAIVGTAVVTILSIRGYFTPERQLGVVVDTLYWYFVAGIFLPIWLVLYISPRIL